MGIQIQSIDGGDIYEAPEGTPIPEGFRTIGGTIERTSSPDSLAGNLFDALRPIHQGMQAIGQGYKDYVAKPATDFVRGGLDMLPFDKGPSSSYALDKTAQTIVPQNTTALGIAGGALLSGGMGAIPAIIGAGAGGLIGGALENRPVGGFGEGAGAGAVGVGLGFGAGVARRHFGQQAADEARIGAALGDINPAFRNEGTAASINKQVSAGEQGTTGAQAEMSRALMAGIQQIDQAVSGTPLTSSAIKAAFPDAPDTLSFAEAVNYIRKLGPRGWSTATGNAAGGAGGMAARDFRAEAVEQIGAQLPPEYQGMWKRFNSSYGQGAILLDLMQEPNVLYPSKPGEPFSGLGVPALQAKAGQYNIEGDLGRRLTGAQMGTLEGALQRGGTYSEGTDYTRGFMARQTMGPGSQSFRIPLPTHYVGNPLQVPSAPFTIGMGNLGEAIRNPYRRTR